MAKKGRIGLDVGSTAVRAVELVGSPPTVVRASQVALPPGAVESSEVRDPGAVSDALSKLWSEGGFKGRQVWLGVGNQRVVVREISLPYLPEKELRQSLGFQVQDLQWHTTGGCGGDNPADVGATVKAQEGEPGAQVIEE